MAELTFQKFLKAYVRQLSEQNTISIIRLAEEASSTNYRLREPLLLYALSTGQSDKLLCATKDASLYKEYHRILTTYLNEQVMAILADGTDELPENYHKVWRSYVSVRDRNQGERETIGLMRDKILRLQAEYEIPVKEIRSAMNLKASKYSRWIVHGDDSAVNLSEARTALNAVRDLIQEQQTPTIQF